MDGNVSADRHLTQYTPPIFNLLPPRLPPGRMRRRRELYGGQGLCRSDMYCVELFLDPSFIMNRRINTPPYFPACCLTRELDAPPSLRVGCAQRNDVLVGLSPFAFSFLGFTCARSITGPSFSYVNSFNVCAKTHSDGIAVIRVS
jgi:hypothetical protein